VAVTWHNPLRLRPVSFHRIGGISSVAPEEDENLKEPAIPTSTDSRGDSSHADSPLQGDPLIGTLVADRYEILCVLGFGGWSIVYKALDRNLNRLVAVKAMHPHLCVDQNKLMRFNREAQAASGLNHPNIAMVHDCGRLRAGRPFITMELVEGASLAELIASKQLSELTKQLDVFKQTCNGLGAVHKAGLIHRDLKPSNIKVAESGLVKVLDFGCAKYILQEPNLLTKSDEAVGTPAYMSPEQCLGKSVDARSDIYALGCIMYEVITGTRAFASDNLLECMQMHLRTMPPSFKATAPNTKISSQLESIVFKAMAKDPVDRFQSVMELRDALDEASKPPSALGFISEPWRRLGAKRRKQFKLVFAVTLAISVFGGSMIWDLMQTRSINFPEGHEVGTIYLVEQVKGQDGARTRLGAAQGVIRVPRRAYVQLAELSDSDSSTLSFLQNLRASDVQRIDLTGIKLEDSAIDCINHVENLDSLSLNKAHLSDAALEKLRLAHLVGLNLTETTISDEALKAIVQNCPKLTWIQLRGNHAVTDSGIITLAGMLDLRAYLFQDVKQLTDACLPALSKAKSMTFLNLRGDNITDDGLKSLLTAPLLRRLDIGATHVTDRGIETLAQMPALSDITLSELKITDACVASLCKFKQLKKLNILSTGISAAGLKKLKSALPNCEIMADG
jgi:serine/threonine protein kinase